MAADGYIFLFSLDSKDSFVAVQELRLKLLQSLGTVKNHILLGKELTLVYLKGTRATEKRRGKCPKWTER